MDDFVYDLENENNRLHKALHVSKQTVRALHYSLKTRDTEYLEVTEDNCKLKQDMARIKRENSALHEKIYHFGDEKVCLIKENTKLKENVPRLEIEKTELEMRVKDLEYENKSLKQKSKDCLQWQKSLMEKEIRIDKLENTIAKMRRQIDTVILYEQHKKKMKNWENFFQSQIENSDSE